MELLRELPAKGRRAVLDLGCGTGNAYDGIKEVFGEIDYIGVDIEESPEVSTRSRDDLRFVSYDGVNIPFPADQFDLVYCHQVFEHVKYQERLLQDVLRVLRHDGYFVGSLSGIEPYHSRSIFNLTPWGWLRVLNENGFTVETMRPGVDGLTLLKRSFSRRLERNYELGPVGELNREILAMEISNVAKNRLMLDFAGHIVFCARPS